MKISKVIKILNEIKKQKGDVSVAFADYEQVKDIVFCKIQNCAIITDGDYILISPKIS